MEYRLVRERRRSVNITVNSSGVLVKAPVGAPLKAIENFMREKSGWIEKKLNEVERVKISMEGLYVDKVPYLGESYGLEIRPANVREKILFHENKFVAHLRPSSNSHQIEKLYTSWLRKKAAEVLKDRIEFYRKILRVSPEKISIRSQKSRWGSASKDGNLNFNCNLLKAPMEIVDYVVVHELCHLRVYNHSRAFWKLVESIVPDFREKRRWLKRNGLALMARKSELPS